MITHIRDPLFIWWFFGSFFAILVGFILAAYLMERHAARKARTKCDVPPTTTPYSRVTRYPPMPPPKPRPAYRACRGDFLLVRGITSNGTDEHTAIVTRAFAGNLVNVTLFPDGAMPLPLTAVTLFQNAQEAQEYLALAYPSTPLMAYPIPKRTDHTSLK
jgi:hypothetical protein